VASPESALRIIHVYFSFNPDQASKVYLRIVHECALYSRFYGNNNDDGDDDGDDNDNVNGNEHIYSPKADGTS